MLIKIGDVMVNPDHVCSAKWEEHKGISTLFLHFVGGGFSSYTGKLALQVWHKLEEVGTLGVEV
jgi:hypothetical protein